MNLNLLYTIGVGNSKSNRYIFMMQFIMYIITIDMANLLLGITMSIVLAVIVSTIFIAVLSYYNSNSATSDDKSRYIKSIHDKNRVFRRLIIESYVMSFAVVMFFYLLDFNVAKYSLYTAPASFLLVLIFLVNHEKSINDRFAELSGCKWIFDYSQLPIITTTEKGGKIEVPMFNEDNKLVIGKTNESIDIKELFGKIPPGTKIFNNELLKPNFSIINFNLSFNYVNITTPCVVYLKNETKHDEKIKKLYIDVLSRYKDLYEIKIAEIDVLRTHIKFNDYEVETYIEKNDYIKRFVISSEVKIQRISIKLKEELSILPLKKVIRRIGQKVKTYNFEKTEEGVFISEVLGNNLVESNITYLEKYMSLNEDEYHCPKEVIFEDLMLESDNENIYDSFRETTKDIPEDSEEKVEANLAKNLYRINIKGELVYVFIEDLATLSEFDELIVSTFINVDVNEMLVLANQDRN